MTVATTAAPGIAHLGTLDDQSMGGAEDQSATGGSTTVSVPRIAEGWTRQVESAGFALVILVFGRKGARW